MIEIVRAKDLAQKDLAVNIWQVLTDVYETSPWSLEQVAEDLKSPLTRYFLAVEGQEVLGFLALQESAFEAEVLQIAVKKAYQGRGLATALFDKLPQDREIFLEVRESNRPALLFYQKENFSEIGRRKAYYHAPVEDAIIMKRECHEG